MIILILFLIFIVYLPPITMILILFDFVSNVLLSIYIAMNRVHISYFGLAFRGICTKKYNEFDLTMFAVLACCVYSLV